MRIPRSALALMLVFSVLLASPVAAHVVMQWGWATPIATTYTTGRDGLTACLSKAAVWHQELGASGINRLRAKFTLRVRYDPGYLPYAPATTGWLYSDEFPDDAQSRWITWKVGFRYARDREYWIHMVLVGERPSFWQEDLKISRSLGDVVCYTQVDAGT